jgi:hypothetical protein
VRFDAGKLLVPLLSTDATVWDLARHDVWFKVLSRNAGFAALNGQHEVTGSRTHQTRCGFEGAFEISPITRLVDSP